MPEHNWQFGMESLSVLTWQKFSPSLIFEIEGLKSYSQHFIFFVTYEWAQKASLFVRAKLSSLMKQHHTSLGLYASMRGTFPFPDLNRCDRKIIFDTQSYMELSNKENKLLWM
jgi:hypothetical protein